MLESAVEVAYDGMVHVQVQLATVFMHAWAGAKVCPEPSMAALEGHLRMLYDAAQSRWRDVALTDAEFVRFVAARTPTGTDPLQMLNGLHTEDLFLTCACVLGTASALDRLDKEFLTKIPRYVAKLDPSPAFADDVSQTLLERLLCAPAGEEPVLVTFSGQGALASWIQVSAVRTAIDLKRNRDAQPTLPIDQITIQNIPLTDSPEADNIRTRCQRALRAALEESFSALSSEQRNLLRFHYASHMTGDQLAKLLRISRATAVRRVAEARTALLGETRRRLKQRLGLGHSEIDSFIRAALSQFDLSLTTLLREKAEDRDPEH